MHSQPYRYHPQAQGLPLGHFPYGDLAAPSTQSTIQNPPFDGLPRTQPDQHFMTSISAATNVLPIYNAMNPVSMTMPQPNMWDDPMQMNNFDEQNSNGYYGYSSPFAINDNGGTYTRGVDLGIPRFMPNEMNSNGFNDNNMVDFHESSYLGEPNKPSYHHGLLDRSNMTCSGLVSSHDFTRLSISHSPHPKQENDDRCGDPLMFERAPTFGLPSSETSDDGGLSSREMTAVDGDEPTIEEPYAKLIHRALMSAPNHSMVLQEIYQWFRENTTKGSTKDGKGWMNSIRHNLSMNAAFKKTERKTPGDETKKSTEWVLEDFAIRGGVQSTTRYRKGTSAKKSMRNEHTAAARQVSGRKGGVATSANKNRCQRRRSKDELRESRRASHRIDSARRDEFEQMKRSQIACRQRSPLTPPDAGRHVSSPYFFSKSQDLLDSPYDPDHFSLSDVQGVYLDGPLFSNNLGHDGGHFHSGPTLASQRFV